MSFVIVTGLPGAGKSTVGAALARHLQLPMLDKDDFLDDLLKHSTDPRAERSTLSRTADEAFIESARRLQSGVLVSFWRRPELSDTSGTPTEWLEDLPNPVEVWCRCLPDVAVRRFLARRRHPGHGDDSRHVEELREQFQALDSLGPLGVGRIVELDTTEEVDIATLAGEILGPDVGT